MKNASSERGEEESVVVWTSGFRNFSTMSCKINFSSFNVLYPADPVCIIFYARRCTSSSPCGLTKNFRKRSSMDNVI